MDRSLQAVARETALGPPVSTGRHRPPPRARPAGNAAWAAFLEGLWAGPPGIGSTCAVASLAYVPAPRLTRFGGRASARGRDEPGVRRRGRGRLLHGRGRRSRPVGGGGVHRHRLRQHGSGGALRVRNRRGRRALPVSWQIRDGAGGQARARPCGHRGVSPRRG